MIPIALFFFILDTEQFTEGQVHVVFPDNPVGTLCPLPLQLKDNLNLY